MKKSQEKKLKELARSLQKNTTDKMGPIRINVAYVR